MSVLPPLRIKVRLFAMQREAAGMKELRLEVPLGATVDDVARTIHPHPTLGETVAFASEVFHGTATEIYKPRRDRHEK